MQPPNLTLRMKMLPTHLSRPPNTSLLHTAGSQYAEKGSRLPPCHGHNTRRSARSSASTRTGRLNHGWKWLPGRSTGSVCKQGTSGADSRYRWGHHSPQSRIDALSGSASLPRALDVGWDRTTSEVRANPETDEHHTAEASFLNS